MTLLRKTLRLGLLGGIGYGIWKTLRARRGTDSWETDSWVSTGGPGATTPVATTPLSAPAPPAPATTPTTPPPAEAPAPPPPTVASTPVHPAAPEPPSGGNGEAVPLPTMADEPPDGRSAAEAAGGGGGPAPSRPAPSRPAKPARTGPARKAPTGKAEPPGERLWVPASEGVCPPTHPVKAKLSSKIFHTPGARNYGRTHADRCYPDEQSAAADGLRPALR